MDLKPKKTKIIIAYPVFIVFLIFLLLTNVFQNGQQHFSHLAISFLHGNLNFIVMPDSWADSVYYLGKHFWPLGPLPAIMIAPFQLLFGSFDLFFKQGYLNLLLVGLIIFLIDRISKKIGFNKSDSIYLTLAFIFASPFIGPAMWPISWWISHAITVLLLFWLIYEYLGQKRLFIYGLIAGLLLATRVTAAVGAITLVIFDLLSTEQQVKTKIKSVLNFIFQTPLFLIIILLLSYNYLRFNNFLEFGYNWQIIGSDLLAQRDRYGLFSLVHIPGNLYYALIKSPDPVFKDGLTHVLQFPFIRADRWGMSLFYSSPWIIYLTVISHRDKTIKFFWLATAIVAVLIFSYYGIGVNQLGYRYALDFLPYLMVIFMIGMYRKYRGLTILARFLIIGAAFFNLYLLLVLFVTKYW